MARPAFLHLPARPGKPRRIGLTHVLDKGAPAGVVDTYLATVADYVDLWKLGWGTAYVAANLGAKIELLARHGVGACVGGTLLEVAWAQGEAEACLAWADAAGFSHVEVSNGVVGMPAGEVHRLIERAATSFVVLAEVGSKDPEAPVSADGWAAEAAADLDAGARWVLAEGRESGNVGLYRPDGHVREEVAGALVAAVGLEAVIFEAPRREQQSWLVRSFGANVNLGNVALEEVCGLEALRLGLRADTVQSREQAGRPAGAPGGR
jgi:phosphosulfolactate synthase